MTGAINKAEIILRQGIALLGGAASPAHRFDSILRHANAARVMTAEGALGDSESQFGGLPQPSYGRFAVLDHTQALRVQDT